MRRRQALASFAAALVTACAAPGQTNTAPTASAAPPSPSPTVPRTKPPRAKVIVALGARGSLILLPWDFAASAGYLEDENLDVEFQYPGAPQSAAALIAGTVDFAGLSIDLTIRAQLQGKPTKMVVSFCRLPGLGIIIPAGTKDKVRALSDLRGATIGIPSAGSGAHVLLTYLMKTHAGLAAETDYKLLAYAPNSPAIALDMGDTQAAASFDPFVTDYVASGKGSLLLDLRTESETIKALGSRYQFTGAITREELIQRDPALVQRVVNALVRANRSIAVSRSEDLAAKLPAAVVGANKDLYIATLDAYKRYMSPDGLIDRPSVDTVIKVNAVFGEAYPQLAQFKPSDKVDVDALFDMRFVSAVPR